MQKSLVTRIGEAIDQHRQAQQRETVQPPDSPGPRRLPGLLRWFLPNGGTLLLIALLIFTQNVWAGQSLRNLAAESATSTGTIAYQGRLADSSGNPLTQTLHMSFRLYKAASGGAPLWTEQWTGSNGVQVSDGLFNVMLGSLTPIPQSVVTGNSTLFLGITVGTDDEMSPRVQLGSVPFAVQALTVPDGSITKAKLAGDVSFVPPANSITTTMLADGAVTSAKINIDATLNMHANNLENVAGISGQTNHNIRIDGVISRYPNGWTKGGWMWLSDVANGPEGGSVRIHITKDLALGNSPFFDVYRTQSDGGAQRLFAVDASGNTSAAGTKAAVVKTAAYGERKLYAVEAPDVRFSDEGMAQLQSGQARVELDPIFLETIESEYLIHITPYGDAGLYVAEVGTDFFVVRAREGDANVSFAWRLSATRKGYGGVRMEEVTAAD